MSMNFRFLITVFRSRLEISRVLRLLKYSQQSNASRSACWIKVCYAKRQATTIASTNYVNFVFIPPRFLHCYQTASGKELIFVRFIESLTARALRLNWRLWNINSLIESYRFDKFLVTSLFIIVAWQWIDVNRALLMTVYWIPRLHDHNSYRT